MRNTRPKTLLGARLAWHGRLASEGRRCRMEEPPEGALVTFADLPAGDGLVILFLQVAESFNKSRRNFG